MYDGVPSIRLEGDKQRALAFVPEAKALLAIVQGVIRYSDANTFTMVQHIDRGYIYALVAPGQNIARIYVEPLTEEEQAEAEILTETLTSIKTDTGWLWIGTLGDVPTTYAPSPCSINTDEDIFTKQPATIRDNVKQQLFYPKRFRLIANDQSWGVSQSRALAGGGANINKKLCLNYFAAGEWSGLARLFVQGLYSRPNTLSLAYHSEVSPGETDLYLYLNTEVTEGASDVKYVRLERTWSINSIIYRDTGFNYWFLNWTSSTVTIHTITFTPAGKQFLKWMQRHSADLLSDSVDGITLAQAEHFLFSTVRQVTSNGAAIPVPHAAGILAIYALGSPWAWGWHANSDGTRISVVLHQNYVPTQYPGSTWQKGALAHIDIFRDIDLELTEGQTEVDRWSFTPTIVEQDAIFNISRGGSRLWTPFALVYDERQHEAFFGDAQDPAYGTSLISHSAPLYCYYTEEDEFITIRWEASYAVNTTTYYYEGVGTWAGKNITWCTMSGTTHDSGYYLRYSPGATEFKYTLYRDGDLEQTHSAKTGTINSAFMATVDFTTPTPEGTDHLIASTFTVDDPCTGYDPFDGQTGSCNFYNYIPAGVQVKYVYTNATYLEDSAPTASQQGGYTWMLVPWGDCEIVYLGSTLLRSGDNMTHSEVIDKHIWCGLVGTGGGFMVPEPACVAETFFISAIGVEWRQLTKRLTATDGAHKLAPFTTTAVDARSESKFATGICTRSSEELYQELDAQAITSYDDPAGGPYTYGYAYAFGLGWDRFIDIDLGDPYTDAVFSTSFYRPEYGMSYLDAVNKDPGSYTLGEAVTGTVHEPGGPYVDIWTARPIGGA